MKSFKQLFYLVEMCKEAAMACASQDLGQNVTAQKIWDLLRYQLLKAVFTFRILDIGFLDHDTMIRQTSWWSKHCRAEILRMDKVLLTTNHNAAPVTNNAPRFSKTFVTNPNWFNSVILDLLQQETRLWRL